MYPLKNIPVKSVKSLKQNLSALTRFLCDDNHFCIMGVDPTFKLCDFSVTPIVYQHLIVKDIKRWKITLAFRDNLN
jgi:hypothetical protein